MKNKIDLEEVEYLAYKLHTNAITEEEKLSLEAWYNAYDDEIFFHGEKEEVVKRKLWAVICSKIRSRKTIPFWIKAASAACLTIAFGILFYVSVNKTSSNPVVFNGKLKEIEPGGNVAILTLANGQKVELKKSPSTRLSEEEGVQIIKSEDGKLSYQRTTDKYALNKPLNTLETPFGGQYQVVLSDGSKVWLNSKSTLRYPVNFRGAEERIVELEGEGYFEVEKDPSHPFIVNSKNQQVKVLGTKFNLNTYTDEPNIATTLVEGSVAIASQHLSLKLSPNEQALNNGKSISKNSIDSRIFVSWKDGYFEFNKTDLPTAMRQISRWYGLKVVYSGKLPSKRFTGKIYRDLKLSSALKILSYFEVKFTVTDHTIYIEN